MPDLRHLFPQNTVSTEQYTYARPVRGGRFLTPPRDRDRHASRIIEAFRSAKQEAQDAAGARPEEERPQGISLEFQSDPDFRLQLKSLDASGVELRNARISEGVMYATVFVPRRKIEVFLRKLEAYGQGLTRTGKPKNQLLAESISEVRLASLQSFWTDAGVFPAGDDSPVWWEVWLDETTSQLDVGEEFRAHYTEA